MDKPIDNHEQPLTTNNTNVMDDYLKKHKLDLKVLPNKKMIKLSDFSSFKMPESVLCPSNITTTSSSFSPKTATSKNSSYSMTSIQLDKSAEQPTQEKVEYTQIKVSDELPCYSMMNNIVVLDDLSHCTQHSSDKEYNYGDGEESSRLSSNISHDEDDDEGEFEEYDDDEYCEELELRTARMMSSSLTTKISLTDVECCVKDSKKIKRMRKKREPSLKLQQKLSIEDLELIVNCVKNKQAQVHIADIKKENYIDKILKVNLLNEESACSIKLTNGSDEALLKKSMFPKDLNTLFETFVNALCGQDLVMDEHGNTKPILKCLVVNCQFQSFSEAEIIRHIKRHLAQDGYTCTTCGHQFASMTNLQRHVKIHSGVTGKEIKCAHCDYKATTLTHVKRHMAHKHLERSLPCPHCSFMGATNAELKIHMARKHLELTGKNPLFLPKYLRKDYQCNICKEQYNDFKEFQTHMYQHTSTSNRFRCNECPYNCKNLSKLKRHMLYHMGARNFECKECGNKFFQMEHLKRHLQSIHNTFIDTKPSQSSNEDCFTRTSTKTTSSSAKKLNKNQELTKLSIKLDKEEAIEPQVEPILKYTNKIDTINKDNNTITDSTYITDSVSGIPTPPSFNIISKSMYKCLHCDHAMSNLFNLNQHIIREHLVRTNKYENKLDALKNIEYEEDENTNHESELNSESFNDNFSDYDISQPYYQCSFCINYKANKKEQFKRHLKASHSSQAIPPIILSNDPILTDPSTKFKCDTCQSYLSNLSEFVKHMNEIHTAQVQIVDTNLSQPMPVLNKDIQEQQPSMLIHQSELIHMSESIPNVNSNNKILTVYHRQQSQQRQIKQHQSRLLPILVNPINKQTYRKFTNSYGGSNPIKHTKNSQNNHHHSLNQQSQHNTVRINPYFLKQHNLLNSNLKQAQYSSNTTKHSINNNLYQNSSNLNQNLLNQTQQHTINNITNQHIMPNNQHFNVSNVNNNSNILINHNHHINCTSDMSSFHIDETIM